MEIIGYKYTIEEDAIQARKDCADYYGLPVAPDDITIYWADYWETLYNEPVFWYIKFDESIRVILGEPTIFEVEDSFLKA